MAHNAPLDIPFEQLPSCAIVRLPLILTLFGFRKTTLWARIRAGEFPAPLQTGPRSVGWRAGEIRDLLNSYSERTTLDPNATAARVMRAAKRAAAKAEQEAQQ